MKSDENTLESDAANLHRLAYEHLRMMSDSQKLVTCNDGPIAECIEQISTSHVLAVSSEFHIFFHFSENLWRVKGIFSGIKLIRTFY